MGDFYNVETILEKRKFEGQLFYLVKWRGYGYEECTWEPKENIATATESLSEFERNPPLKILKARMDSAKQEDKRKVATNNYKQLKKIVDDLILDRERELDTEAMEKDKKVRELEKSMTTVKKCSSMRFLKQEVEIKEERPFLVENKHKKIKRKRKLKIYGAKKIKEVA